MLHFWQIFRDFLKREKLRDAGKLSKDKQKEIQGDLKKILTKEQQKIWKEEKDKKKEWFFYFEDSAIKATNYKFILIYKIGNEQSYDTNLLLKNPYIRTNL